MDTTGRPPIGAARRWEANAQLLFEALSSQGIDLTTDDQRAVEWIAGWEPQTARVIASWIARAAAAVRGDTSDYRG